MWFLSAAPGPAAFELFNRFRLSHPAHWRIDAGANHHLQNRGCKNRGTCAVFFDYTVLDPFHVPNQFLIHLAGVRMSMPGTMKQIMQPTHHLNFLMLTFIILCYLSSILGNWRDYYGDFGTPTRLKVTYSTTMGGIAATPAQQSLLTA